MNTIDPSKAFKIDFSGRWFHGGAEIKREALVKLFADRALKIDEEGHYWLSTPYEKYPVEVEDVPFVIVDYREDKDGFIFTTNIGDTMSGRIEMRHNTQEGMDLPYVHIRNGLYARLSRAVYYEMADKGLLA